MRSGGSAGGFDVLAIYLNRRFGLSIPNAGFALNVVPPAAGILLLDLEIVIYSGLFYDVCSRVVVVVLGGGHKKRQKKVMESKKDLHFLASCIKSAQFFSLERPLWRRLTNCHMYRKGGPDG